MELRNAEWDVLKMKMNSGQSPLSLSRAGCPALHGHGLHSELEAWKEKRAKTEISAGTPGFGIFFSIFLGHALRRRSRSGFASGDMKRGMRTSSLQKGV